LTDRLICLILKELLPFLKELLPFLTWNISSQSLCTPTF
jgi:hypothetical protein